MSLILANFPRNKGFTDFHCCTLLRKGDVKRVIDVGAGTGLLSMYAAGSSPAVTEVVAVEANTDMAKIANEIVAMNDDEDDVAGCAVLLCMSITFALN